MFFLRPCSPSLACGAAFRRTDAPSCAANEAALRCLSIALRGSGGDATPDPPGGYTLKLLVHSNYVPAILGPGGSSIKALEAGSGARVQVAREERHPLRGANEDLIKVRGLLSPCSAVMMPVALGACGLRA